jgi:hypothetical protein
MQKSAKLLKIAKKFWVKVEDRFTSLMEEK